MNFLPPWLRPRSVLFTAFMLAAPLTETLAEGEYPLKRIEVVFLAGQSNADGRAPAAPALAALLRPRADVFFYSHLHGEPPGSNGTLGRLGPLRPGRTQFPTGGFGPELGLGHAMAERLAVTHPDSRLAIIKYAKGGSSLHADWRVPDPVSGLPAGPHYVIFQKVAHDGLAALRAAHPEAEIRLLGLVWVQGESDVSDGEAPARAYGHNLGAFINDCRAILGAPDLPVLVARLSRNQRKLSDPRAASAERFLQVRAAQENVARNTPQVHLLDTDDPAFTFLADQLHLDTKGQVSLGELVAKSLALP